MKKNNYKLSKLLQLIKEVHKKKPKRVWVFRQGYLNIVNNYWQYTEAQKDIFIKEHGKGKLLTDPDYEENQMIFSSAALSCYNFMRICIMGCKILGDNAMQSGITDDAISKLQNFRLEKNNVRFIKKIIDVRNYVGAHPDDPRRLYTGGMSWTYPERKLAFQSINLQSFSLNSKETKLNPEEDFEALTEYVLKLTDHLRHCWGLGESEYIKRIRTL